MLFEINFTNTHPVTRYKISSCQNWHQENSQESTPPSKVCKYFPGIKHKLSTVMAFIFFRQDVN